MAMRALMTGVARISLMLGRFSQLSVSMRSMRSRSSLLRVAGGGGYCPLMICAAGWESVESHSGALAPRST